MAGRLLSSDGYRFVMKVMERKLMERASKEMLPDFSDKEAIWKNDKDIIGRLYLGKK